MFDIIYIFSYNKVVKDVLHLIESKGGLVNGK